MKIVEEEADESQFWLEFLSETFEDKQEEIKKLIKEADELIAICVASIKRVKTRL